MKIIYHCFGGAHSSVVAASIHLGLLQKHRPPTAEELMSIPYYDKTNNNHFGTIRFMGIDEYGNDIYVLGKKSLGDRFSNILMGIAEILGVKNNILTINTMNNINVIMKIGGFMSRRLGWVSIGRPIVIKGTQSSFFDIVRVVDQIKLKVMTKV
ncbi:hypothetical protein SYNTR_1244 [Candidatus Syntrophocurvum alkaliphilum]|uniref:DUF3189 family protein n=1 Tax=Candidatus Syntrophocurvum alkaliphilum TaxID=2293317 RepID=A0A6I6DFI1_9FIRM|nr:DUF3189 family protein [Candidatus Syntrophocurvum alkaliphilum]QGT99837.1 hypothetical protein SYNTR_1244 [Candidatus Syntrophocurvum alkaliphilum]